MSNALQSYFDNIYDKTHLNIERYVASKFNNYHDVEDILQEVYLEFYKTLCRHGSNYISEPESFLITIAKKKLIRRYALKNKLKCFIPLIKVNSQDEEYTVSDFSDIEGAYNDIDEELIKQETVDMVWEIINSMGEETVEIFRLRFLDELHVNEIAEKINLPVYTVKNRLYRTLDEIRAALKGSNSV